MRLTERIQKNWRSLALAGLTALNGCATVQPGIQSTVQTEPPRTALELAEPAKTIQEIKEKYDCGCVGIGSANSPSLQLARNISAHEARVDYMKTCLGKTEALLTRVSVWYAQGDDGKVYGIAFKPEQKSQ